MGLVTSYNLLTIFATSYISELDRVLNIHWKRLLTKMNSKTIPVICKGPYGKSLEFNKFNAWTSDAVSSISIKMAPLPFTAKYVKAFNWWSYTSFKICCFSENKKKKISVTADISFTEIGSSKAGVNICKNQTFGLVLTDSDGKSTSYLKDVFGTVSRRILRDSNEVNLNRVTI